MEEKLDNERVITSDMDMADQAALLVSYRTAHEICLDSWRYEQCQAEMEAAYKEFDEAADEVWSKSDDEEDIMGSDKAAPGYHDHEARTSKGIAGSEEELCMVGRDRSGGHRSSPPPEAKLGGIIIDQLFA
ncbi:hypothetical protein D1007_11439 [Hordeum vulgare]|nr:hypothetical protein D1007_11439 [Hordeum vulgare]